jgi:predicted ribosome quality control (RQC) complex YloA/Tae2 family protein
MNLFPEQPISCFTKQNQLYRLKDVLTLPRTTLAMQEILTHSMRHQQFIAPVNMIPWFSDVLKVSEKTIKTGLAELDERNFTLARKHKSCIINPAFANKAEVLSGQLQQIVVEPNGYELDSLITEVTKMREFNQGLSPKAQIIDKMALQYAVNALANERIRRLENEVCELKEGLKWLMSRASDEDAAKARAMFHVVQ